MKPVWHQRVAVRLSAGNGGELEHLDRGLLFCRPVPAEQVTGQLDQPQAFLLEQHLLQAVNERGLSERRREQHGRSIFPSGVRGSGQGGQALRELLGRSRVADKLIAPVRARLESGAGQPRLAGQVGGRWGNDRRQRGVQRRPGPLATNRPNTALSLEVDGCIMRV
jgi:hypothetical protein